MRTKANNITYLRLPPRTSIDTARNIADMALPYATTLRGRLLQTGLTSLSQPGFALDEAQTVVLLVAASDVTLLRVDVPPLPAHRLHLVLPALVEGRLIGDGSWHGRGRCVNRAFAAYAPCLCNCVCHCKQIISLQR